MPPTDRDPLAATERLLVDGTNLLHALTRRSGAAPPAALIGRLRAVVPATVSIELIFDGPGEPGLRGERIASGTTVRYGGARSADAVILTHVDQVRRSDGPDGTAALLVVTDDRELRHGAQLRGARTAGSAWLIGRLQTGRLSSPSVGNKKPAAVPAETDDDRAGWTPGRGATTKRGNPRKPPRTGRTGRMPA